MIAAPAKPDKTEPNADIPAVVRKRSPWLYSWFQWYVRRYLAKHFHAVRLLDTDIDPASLRGPILVALNHPSWWDPLLCIQLSRLFGDKTHYGPIDARALERYRFFERLGFFGVEQHSLRGASRFLDTSLKILRNEEAVLWITCQGHFTDPRQRPMEILPGTGHVAARLERGVILPLALEYPFWTERTPEALAYFGQPIAIENFAHLDSKQWTKLVADRLEIAQDVLAEAAKKRHASEFITLVKGKSGTNFVYDAWQKTKAFLRGTSYHQDHGSVAPKAMKGMRS